MRYFYAVMWVGIFGALGWMVHTGEALTYTGRRGGGFAELLRGLVENVGQTTVALGLLLIGFGFAAWSIWGKEEEAEGPTS